MLVLNIGSWLWTGQLISLVLLIYSCVTSLFIMLWVRRSSWAVFLLYTALAWGHLLGCIQVTTGLESSRRLHSHVPFFSMMTLSLHRFSCHLVEASLSSRMAWCLASPESMGVEAVRLCLELANCFFHHILWSVRRPRSPTRSGGKEIDSIS